MRTFCGDCILALLVGRHLCTGTGINFDARWPLENPINHYFRVAMQQATASQDCALDVAPEVQPRGRSIL